VVEQPGTIRILQNGALLPTPFLDIRSRVTFSGEMGLLGVAFHPGFAKSGRLYVNYVRGALMQRQSVIAEYQVSATDANQADPATERILLVIDQPYDNHKGGQLAFGAGMEKHIHPITGRPFMQEVVAALTTSLNG
jgi:glucose/arabinose dehydrogenase